MESLIHTVLWNSQTGVLYSYLVDCSPISDLFGKGEPILGDA